MRYLGGWLIAGMLGLLILSGCAQWESVNSVATVEGQPVAKHEFDKAYRRTLQMMRIDPTSDQLAKLGEVNRQFKKMAMDTVILQALIDQEARKRHLEVTDTEVQADLAKQIAGVGGEKAFETQLQQFRLTRQEVLGMLREQRLKDKLATQIGQDRLQISEQAMNDFYRQHTAMFDQPEKVRARHILVKTDPAGRGNATQRTERQRKAQTLYNQVTLKPDTFEAVARQHSEDPGSGAQGGDLGYFARQDMVAPFSKAAFDTKPGQIHPGVVESTFGFHIIQVLDRKAPEKKTFDQAREDIRSMLEAQQKQQVLHDWLETRRKSAKIVLKPEYDFQQAAVLIKPDAAKQ